MKLVIDQGNTLIKIGVFDKDRLILSEIKNIIDKEWIDHVINDYPISKSIISSVRSDDKELFLTISAALPNIIMFNNEFKLPFKNSYQTPLTIGKDRLAAIAGAIEIFPGLPLLVFDAGTALTIEYINENAEFIGGNISPGLNTRFKSLHQFTGQLPLLGQTDQDMLIGNTTNSAIIAGVQNSMVFEIDEYIERFKQQYPTLKAIITGGDAEFFAVRLKNIIFVEVNLVLKGLNRILDYNL